ncbi:MAG: DUF6516 family protein [bacterium]
MPWSLSNYEELVYKIQELSEHITYSALVLKRRSKLAAVLSGEVKFAQDITLKVYENLRFIAHETDFILDYSYEVRKNDSVEYWYDSQPHPNDPSLQSTHPHHKHIPPNIKHHRIPESGLSFSEPNLPFLIRTIEELFFVK